MPIQIDTATGDRVVMAVAEGITEQISAVEAVGYHGLTLEVTTFAGDGVGAAARIFLDDDECAALAQYIRANVGKARGFDA